MQMFSLRCFSCGEEFSRGERIYRCSRCEGLLEVVMDVDKIEVTKEEVEKRELGVWKYREFMPVGKDAKIITLKEGGTPLYRAPEIGKELGIKELYIKNEGANPTGSFKDRGMTVGITKALEFGVEIVGCASTGNTSASLSAYAAKAKIKCLVLLPSGKIALGKLAQAILYGAEVMGVKGNFDAAFRLIKEASEKLDIYLLNSINPWRLEGQKSIGFEIVDGLGWEVPDRIIVPVGNCGNSSAIWKGMKEFHEHGFIDSLPKLTGIQAEGSAPVVEAFRKGKETIVPIKNPETIATAIRIGNPVSAAKTLRGVKESGGYLEAVSDNEIIAAQKLIARKEGIGVEPASASTIAGLRKLLDKGVIDPSERIVCITTGHALKDPEVIFKKYKEPVEIEPDIESLKKAIGR